MADVNWDEFDKYHGKGFDAALADWNKTPKFDYRLTDEFDAENEYFQLGYRKGWSYAVEQDVQSRYPGYDNPHSSPPDWFDPADAGEVW